MNDPFAQSGFLMLTGTDPIDLSNDPIQGFTPVGGAAVIAAIDFPSARAGTGYNGDQAIIGLSLAEGVFYPIPAGGVEGSGITLTSGTLIGWRD